MRESYDIEMMERGRASRNNPMRYFDWDEAARRIVQANGKNVFVMLDKDRAANCAVIVKEGVVVLDDDDCYQGSTWDIPTLGIDGEEKPCWTMDKQWFGARAWWPESALQIMRVGGYSFAVSEESEV